MPIRVTLRMPWPWGYVSSSASTRESMVPSPRLLRPGAVLVAAHPYCLSEARRANRGTARFAIEWTSLGQRVHRFELVNRHDVFSWVAEVQLPYIASGDFHRLEHLENWKTIIPCSKSEGAVLSYLRSTAPVHITRFESQRRRGALAA
jgi:hypothetical protein